MGAVVEQKVAVEKERVHHLVVWLNNLCKWNPARRVRRCGLVQLPRSPRPPLHNHNNSNNNHKQGLLAALAKRQKQTRAVTIRKCLKRWTHNLIAWTSMGHCGLRS